MADLDLIGLPTTSTIATRYNTCATSFSRLCQLSAKPDYHFSNQVAPSAVQDEFGRLRVWAGNIGAHRTGRVSLDYRLREASHMYQRVTELLDELNNTLEDAVAIISGERKPYDEEEFSDSDSSTSSSSGDKSELTVDGHEHKGSPESTTELQQIALDVNDIVSCLYKLAVAIRNPAPSDRLAKSALIDTSHFLHWDVRHVAEKYPVADPSLIQRLGDANSKRRQLLKYMEKHHGKLARNVSTLPQIEERPKIANDPLSDLPKALQLTEAKIEDAQSQPATVRTAPSAVATTVNTQTTVATFVEVEEDLIITDAQSETSSATSVSTSDDGALHVPPPPRGAMDNEPFECPYCFDMMTTRSMISWRKHVFRDLQPYMCTFAECNRPNRMFGSRHQWRLHEIQNHRREWLCNACQQTFSSKIDIECHMRDGHPGSFAEQQLSALIEMCERPIGNATLEKCPLCLQEGQLLKSHLARHMQTLALFTLPRKDSDSDEDMASIGAHVWESDEDADEERKDVTGELDSGSDLSSEAQREAPDMLEERDKDLESQEIGHARYGHVAQDNDEITVDHGDDVNVLDEGQSKDKDVDQDESVEALIERMADSDPNSEERQVLQRKLNVKSDNETSQLRKDREREPDLAVQQGDPEYLLFVEGLGREITEFQLMSVFEYNFKSCYSASVRHDPKTNNYYGVVRFSEESEQQRAMEDLQGTYCGSRKMQIFTLPPKDWVFSVGGIDDSSSQPASKIVEGDAVSRKDGLLGVPQSESNLARNGKRPEVSPLTQGDTQYSSLNESAPVGLTHAEQVEVPPNFLPFPKLVDLPPNIPPDDDEKERILENARLPVLGSDDPEVQLTWADDALRWAETNQADGERLSKRRSTPRIEDQIRRDAMAIVEFLADQTHPRAMFIKGMWLEFGKCGFRVDKKDSWQHYRTAAEKGYSRAHYRMGMMYEMSNDAAKGIEMHRKGVSLGDAAASYRMGMMELLGQHGVAQNYEHAISLITISAEKADENAPQGAYVLGMLQINELPQIYVPDVYLSRSISQGRTNVEKAAFMGFAKAQTRMGEAYELAELDCPFDPIKSLHYYVLSARQGEAEAEMAISKWLLSGWEGVFEKSERIAYEYAQRAAMSGYALAEFALGYYAEIGIHVPIDMQNAMIWYEKAAAKGHKDAIQRLETLKRSKSYQQELERQSPPKPVAPSPYKKPSYEPPQLPPGSNEILGRPYISPAASVLSTRRQLSPEEEAAEQERLYYRRTQGPHLKMPMPGLIPPTSDTIARGGTGRPDNTQYSDYYSEGAHSAGTTPDIQRAETPEATHKVAPHRDFGFLGDDPDNTGTRPANSLQGMSDVVEAKKKEKSIAGRIRKVFGRSKDEPETSRK